MILEMIWVALVMYLLGFIFVLGLVEPIDDDDRYAPLRLAILWPFISLVFIWYMIWESIYG